MLVAIVLVFAGITVNAQTADSVIKVFWEYINCWDQKEYEKMAEYLYPDILAQIGGVQNFKEFMIAADNRILASGFLLQIRNIEILENSVEYSGLHTKIYVLYYKIPFTFKDKTGYIGGCSIGIPKDGKWYLVSPDKKTKEFLLGIDEGFGDVSIEPQKRVFDNKEF